MSNEIKYNFSLKYANGKLKNSTDSGNVCISQDEAKMIATVQTIGYLAHEALCICDLTSVGVSTFCNLDDTNSVSIGSDVPCTIAAATGNISIDDFSLLSGVTVTIDGTDLVEGVDWIAAADNDSTATSLASAITGIVASVSAAAITNSIVITAVATGIAGNNITMVSSTALGITLSGATLTGGSDGFVPFIKLKPLEQYIVRLGTMNLYALAENADVDLQFTIYAD
jgi:hypothetical protein